MLIVYPILLLLAVLAIGGLALSRNGHQHTARHWDYIASRLRLELYAAQDELDKHSPTDAASTLADRIRSLAAKAKATGCPGCANIGSL